MCDDVGSGFSRVTATRWRPTLRSAQFVPDAAAAPVLVQVAALYQRAEVPLERVAAGAGQPDGLADGDATLISSLRTCSARERRKNTSHGCQLGAWVLIVPCEQFRLQARRVEGRCRLEHDSSDADQVAGARAQIPGGDGDSRTAGRPRDDRARVRAEFGNRSPAGPG